VFESRTRIDHRKEVPVVRFLSALLFLVTFPPLPAHAGPTKPEDVLPYLESVYKAGDIDAYTDLLTSDYKFVLEDMHAGWDKTMDLSGTRKLFEAASVELSFPKEVSIKPGPQPETWIIEDVPGSLQVTQKKDAKVFKVQNTFSFTIRDEGGKLRIAEWRQKPTK
jgi:hypothetical protein